MSAPNRARPPVIGSAMTQVMAVSLIVVAVSLIYGEIGGHRPIPFDDSLYLSDNAWVLKGLTWEGVIWAFTNVDAANWHPLTWLSHMADQEMFGPLLGGHMIQNLFWHALNSVLVYLLLGRLGIGRPLALALALVFACHPLNVESVAWLSQRKNQLSTLLLLASVLVYLDWRDSGRRLALALLVIAYSLSLMAKAMGVTLPAILLVFEALEGRDLLRGWWRSRDVGAFLRWGWRVVGRLSPMVLAAGAVAAATFLAQREIGAVATLETVSLPGRFANASASLGVYLGKFLWPQELSLFYPLPNQPDWGGAALGWFALAAGTLLVALAAGRRPRVVLGWAWFLLSLLPVIGLVQVGSQSHADRYMYVPMIGLLILAGHLLDGLPIPGCRFPRAAWLAGIGAFAVGMGLHAWAYVPFWRNAETAYRRSLEVGGVSYSMTLNLAATLTNLNFLKSAEPYAILAQTLWPDRPMTSSNLASLYARMGRFDLAERNFRRAIEIDPANVQYHYMLGLVLIYLGRGPEAEETLQHALKMLPDESDWRTTNRMIREVLLRRTPLAGEQARALIEAGTPEAGGSATVPDVQAGTR
jgi:protein O-mannosyl-transferase